MGRWVEHLRGSWPMVLARSTPRLPFVLALGLVLTTPLAAAGQSASPVGGDGALESGRARRSGIEVRTALEFSLIEARTEFTFEHVINSDPENFEAVEMSTPDRVLPFAVGPRLEAGYFFSLPRGFGLYPRMAGSWAITPFPRRSEEHQGQTYRYSELQEFWEVSLGAEFLFLQTKLGIAFDVGFGYLVPHPRSIEPEEMHAMPHNVSGPEMRAGLSYRLMTTSYMSLGTTLFFSRMTYPEHSDDPGTVSAHRVGLSVQAEWGRR